MSDQTNPPEPDKALVAPEQPSDSDSVTLAVTRPFWCTAFNVPEDDGGTLVIDRSGVEVPAKDAERVTALAATNGVTITEVSN